MTTRINLNYLRELYSVLLGKTDEELDDFDINDPAQRSWLFDEMVKTFDRFGPRSKMHVINGLSYIADSSREDEHWRYVVPHDIPLTPVPDKANYVGELLRRLVGRRLIAPIALGDVILDDEIGPSGLDTQN